MKKIIYIGPDKYFNLKADLITKNKMDAISFDFTNVHKSRDVIYNQELKLYEFDGDNPKIDENNGKLKLAGGVKNWIYTNELDRTYWDLINEFNDNRFCRIENNTVYLVVLLEPKNYVVYDTKLDIVITDIIFNNDLNKICTNQLSFSYSKNSIYDEPIIANLKSFGNEINECKTTYINEKQAFLYCKFKINDTQNLTEYTQSLSISVTADTWTTSKSTSYYILDGNNVIELKRKPDGSFDGYTPTHIFAYPSNELTRNDTKYKDELLHLKIAQELLTDFKHGRSTVQFMLPEVELYYADRDGNIIENEEKINSMNLKLGDVIVLRNLKDDGFIGGRYKASLSYEKIPKQFEITGIEYNYSGTMQYVIKAMERPFSQVEYVALENLT